MSGLNVLLTIWIWYIKLHKQVCKTVGASLAASLEPSACRPNVVNLSVFYRYYFGRCYLKCVNWFHFLILVGDPLYNRTWYFHDGQTCSSPCWVANFCWRHQNTRNTGKMSVFGLCATRKVFRDLIRGQQTWHNVFPGISAGPQISVAL